MLVGHDWGASISYRAAAAAPERIRAICAIAIPHPRLLKPSPRLLWGARHFLTLRLPTGSRLVRRHDFAYIDTLISRWAPRWSGPERDACLRDVKRCFSDPRVLDAALAYYRENSREGLSNMSQPGLIVGGTTDIVGTRSCSSERLRRSTAPATCSSRREPATGPIGRPRIYSRKDCSPFWPARPPEGEPRP